MPEIGREDVKKANGRENGAGQRFLDFDIVIDDLRIGGQTGGDKLSDIGAVKTFIETDLVELRGWMNRRERAQRRVAAGKQRTWQPEKHTRHKNDAQTGQV